MIQTELAPPNLEEENVAEMLMNTFIQRRDLYAKQLDDGRYICIKKPLTTSHLISHLRGEITLGAYVLDQMSQAKFVVFDGDDDRQFQSLIQLRTNLMNDGIPSYLESSRRGGHLWLFFDQPIQGKIAREFGSGLKKRFNLPEMEFFPKQNEVSSGPGSLIRLPFGVHRKDGKRYGFLNSQLEPLNHLFEEQIQIFYEPDVVSQGTIYKIAKKSYRNEAKINRQLIRTPERQALSTQIKASISVYDFIIHYVELSPDGRGLCPFHDDRVSSFAVEMKDNYWHCFAGCGGGSIIDFWMKYRDCNFTKAVRELAKMVIK